MIIKHRYVESFGCYIAVVPTENPRRTAVIDARHRTAARHGGPIHTHQPLPTSRSIHSDRDGTGILPNRIDTRAELNASRKYSKNRNGILATYENLAVRDGGNGEFYPVRESIPAGSRLIRVVDLQRQIRSIIGREQSRRAHAQGPDNSVAVTVGRNTRRRAWIRKHA